MKIEEIRLHLQYVVDVMAAKNYPSPKTGIVVFSGEPGGVLIQHLGADGNWPMLQGTVYFAVGDNLEEKLLDAMLWADAAPVYKPQGLPDLNTLNDPFGGVEGVV